MRGTPVEWGLLIMGALGIAGFVKADFEPSDGLVIAAGVIAVVLAVWVIKTYPKPEEVYSPLLGRRRLRSPYSPTWLVFPFALICAWVFNVYGAGMALAAVAGTSYTRPAQVLYSATNNPSRRARRSGRKSCLAVTAVIQTGRGPLRVHHCDTSLRGIILGPGTRVTYRTRESSLGMFVDMQYDWSPVNAALEMAKRAEEQARQAQEGAAR